MPAISLRESWVLSVNAAHNERSPVCGSFHNLAISCNASLRSLSLSSFVAFELGTCGVALANTNWCASVVFPLPGAPATMLNENSGRPPHTISSRPGTPVGSLLIFTLSWVLMLFSHSRNRYHRQLPR